MGKGRAAKHGLQPRPTQEQVLSRLEKKLEEKRMRKQCEVTLVKNTLSSEIHKESFQKYVSLEGIDGTKVFYKNDGLSQFTAKDLANAINIPDYVDMEYAFKDISSLSSCIGDCVEEENTRIRIYMRSEENEIEFAMLQRSLEVFYLQGKSLENLQGWILQYGSIFVFGGSDFTLKQSCERLAESFKHLMQSAD